MTRFRIPEILLGCLLTLAVFALGVLFAGRVTPSTTDSFTGSMWLTRDAAGFFAFIATIIAAAQAFMFWRQLRYMSKGMVDATKAANAAAIQARTIVATERPYIFILPRTDGGSPFNRTIAYDIRNFGRTPAIIVRVSVGLRVISNFEANPDYLSLFSRETRMVIAPESTPDPNRKPSVYHKMKPFIEGDLAAVARGDAKMCLIGLVEYTSIQNEVLQTGFCFEYFPVTNSWNIVGDEKFNFNI